MLQGGGTDGQRLVAMFFYIRLRECYNDTVQRNVPLAITRL